MILFRFTSSSGNQNQMSVYNQLISIRHKDMLIWGKHANCEW